MRSTKLRGLTLFPIVCAAVASFWAAGALRGADDLARVSSWEAPRVDVEALLAEDAVRTGPGVPRRVATRVETALSPGAAGRWEDAPGGGQLWRLEVVSRGALWMRLHFDRFRLPDGATLRVDGPARAAADEPYTSADANDGVLWTHPVAGDRLVVELRWPERLRGRTPDLRIGGLSHGYKIAGPLGADLEQGPDGEQGAAGRQSGTCNVDVNCEDAWQTQKDGILMLLIPGGMGDVQCTGTLINNTAQDCRPLVLTADHCIDNPTQVGGIAFIFFYERNGCRAGTSSQAASRVGATLLASRSVAQGSDFALLEMNGGVGIPFSGSYFNGWNRSPDPTSEAWTIHHPNGDPKKISREADPLVTTPDPGPGHGADPENYWRVSEWDMGTTEPGSSGAPLFGPDHRVVGQLYGGNATCQDPTDDDFGKFSASWTGGGEPGIRLSDLLDPGGTGAMTLDGIRVDLCWSPRPVLEPDGATVDDSALDGDGIAEPGETIGLQVSVHNAGNLGATGVNGSLSNPVPAIPIVDGQATWPDLAPAQSGISDAPHFQVEIPPDLSCGNRVVLDLDLTADQSPGAWSGQVAVSTGTFVESDEVFFDDMESGVNGWTVQKVQGSVDWVQVEDRSVSPTHSWFAADAGSRTDLRLLMPAIPDLPPNARLTFRHFISAENNGFDGIDGGVLEYCTAGAGCAGDASWTDAGPRITLGGYRSIIDASFSPLNGREAWSDVFLTWQEVEVDFAAEEGEELRVRWRFASDLSTPGEGWYVDDVLLVSDQYTCNCRSDADCDDADVCTADSCDTGNGECSNVPLPDGDGDQVCDMIDNCPDAPNQNQANFDGDAYGDVCEVGTLLVDADLSGRVDGFDLARLARAFGARSGIDPHYDASVDFIHDDQSPTMVDGADLVELSLSFGQGSPAGD